MLTYNDEHRENYYALLLAILSPIEISIEESFAIMAGQKEFPVEKDPTPELAEEVARRIMNHTVVYRRLERRHGVGREQIAKLVKAMREVYHEEDEQKKPQKKCGYSYFFDYSNDRGAGGARVV